MDVVQYDMLAWAIAICTVATTTAKACTYMSCMTDEEAPYFHSVINAPHCQCQEALIFWRALTRGNVVVAIRQLTEALAVAQPCLHDPCMPWTEVVKFDQLGLVKGPMGLLGGWRRVGGHSCW